MPIRLYNYYYIFQVLDTRPNQGQIHVAQIFIPLPANHTPADSAKAYNLIHKVDSLLKHGAQFSKVAQKYSQDFRSAVRGGDIGWIHSGQTVPAFEQAAFSIKKIGQVVGPVQTNLGFHFIKLLGRKSYSNYDSVKPLLLNYFKSTPYYKLIYSSVIDSLKKVYHFKQLGSLDTIRNHLSNDLFKGRWSDSTLINNTNPLCQIQNQICTYRDFALWLKHNLHPYPPQNMDKLAQTLFNNFVSYRIKLYHVLQLAKNQNTPFGQLANEFYEGLLLFNISNDSVWQKAASDSIGLKKFYQQNASKYNNLQYISVFNVKTKKDKRKLIRLLKKIHPQIADSSLLTHLQDTNITFVTKKLISAKTDKKFNFVFQTLKKHPDKKIISSPDGHTIVYLNYKFPQIRGLVIADYQDWLEKQWINHLRKQHKIYINYSLLNKIETQLKNQNHKHQ
jgi:peptidyl-prolyl cis-trans isomerase SurA